MTEHEHDDFLARLRGDAAPLRYRVDEATLARIRERIQSRLAQREPALADLLASWLRPLAAATAAVAVAAAISFATLETAEPLALGEDAVAIAVAGDIYRVPQ